MHTSPLRPPVFEDAEMEDEVMSSHHWMFAAYAALAPLMARSGISLIVWQYVH